MSVVIFLSCNGPGCDTILPVDAHDVSAARLEARLKGWDTTRHYESRSTPPKWVTEDQCPEHQVTKLSNAPADITHRLPAEECALGKQCPALHVQERGRSAVFHWCGHDPLGHRMANLLIRDGYDTVKRVRAASAADLLDLRGFGRICVERWTAFKELSTGA